jgi:hypothetical protein
MAAGFALSSANVTGPDGAVHSKVSVLVRNNVLKLKARGVSDPVVLDETVISSERIGRREWKVTTAAGEFTMTRQPCNCHSR